MPLHRPPSAKGILYLAFNQDNTCISIADYKGIKIYSLETHKVLYQSDLGAVSIAEMLFCTSLMAYVGAGEQPTLTPRKLFLVNTATGSVIQDISLPTSVLAVRLNRERLVVVLERRTLVHDLKTLELLRTLETPSNPKGCCALCTCFDPCLLALPSSSTSGTMRVYNAAITGSSVECEVTAHNSPVAVMAWNQDASLLASASNKGTVLRVHKMPQANKVYSFRRGSRPAPIHSLAFSPLDIQPPLLCATSGHGTVHIFRLEQPDRHPAASAAVGFLCSVMPPRLTDVVEPPRCIATIKLPGRGVPAICAVQSVSSQQNGGGTTDSSLADDLNANAGGGMGIINVMVATAEGLFYEYHVQDLKAPQGPTCTLEGESYLLAQKI
ncbi:MAG: autophagy-related 18-like [Trebouxia sp. A1-2]|nr:MAG: autophagy-related 18-like [Trebouxia sp. A1-2]